MLFQSPQCDSANTSGTSTPTNEHEQGIMTYNALAGASFEAGPSFVNAYYGGVQAAAGPVSHQNSGQGPAAAAVVMSQRGLGQSGRDRVDEALQRLSVDGDGTSRRVEGEIRRLMDRVHLDNSSGMSESAAELKRIGAALSRCMALRDKYIKSSVQLEGMNPKNRPGWAIYPPPPAPAWHNFNEPAEAAPAEFRFDDCEIPAADGCVFELGADGLYAVHESAAARASGSAAFTSAASIKEFYMDLDY
ncbi:AMP deaminase, partial [Coemansia nantahalensis]